MDKFEESNVIDGYTFKELQEYYKLAKNGKWLLYVVGIIDLLLSFWGVMQGALGGYIIATLFGIFSIPIFIWQLTGYTYDVDLKSSAEHIDRNCEYNKVYFSKKAASEILSKERAAKIMAVICFISAVLVIAVFVAFSIFLDGSDSNNTEDVIFRVATPLICTANLLLCFGIYFLVYVKRYKFIKKYHCKNCGKFFTYTVTVSYTHNAKKEKRDAEYEKKDVFAGEIHVNGKTAYVWKPEYYETKSAAEYEISTAEHVRACMFCGKRLVENKRYEYKIRDL